jgi:hypothetical protein
MDPGSSLCELRAVGDFLGQGVLERVARLRVDRLVVEKLRLTQAPQRAGELVVGEVRDSTGSPRRGRQRELLRSHHWTCPVRQARDGRWIFRLYELIEFLLRHVGDAHGLLLLVFRQTALFPASR